MKKSHVGIPIGEPVEEYLTKPYFDDDGVQVTSGIGRDGKEYPDPVPMAPPVGYDHPPDLVTMIRSMVRAEEFRRAVDAEGFETFDEADDFETEDDMEFFDKLTDYEKVFEVPTPAPEKAETPKIAAKVGGGEGAASPEQAAPTPAEKGSTGSSSS